MCQNKPSLIKADISLKDAPSDTVDEADANMVDEDEGSDMEVDDDDDEDDVDMELDDTSNLVFDTTRADNFNLDFLVCTATPDSGPKLVLLYITCKQKLAEYTDLQSQYNFRKMIAITGI